MDEKVRDGIFKDGEILLCLDNFLQPFRMEFLIALRTCGPDGWTS